MVLQLNSSKILKARGRPRTFEEGDALDRATKVFWAKGYDGATIDDLVAATGVSRPSLYATFGDKEALFMRCIEHYGETVVAPAMAALENGQPVREAIASFFKQKIESTTGEDTPSGCMMACVAPAVDDAKVREFSARALAQAEAAFEERFRQAVESGELPPNFPCATRSRQISGLAMSLALRARVGTSRATLLADAEEGIALILGPGWDE